MKKLAVCLTLAAFATITSLQAGENCAKAKTACTEKTKVSATACSATTATSACAEKTKVSATATTACSASKGEEACCAKKATAKADRRQLKGATLLVQR